MDLNGLYCNDFLDSHPAAQKCMQVLHEHEGWLIWGHSFPTCPKSEVKFPDLKDLDGSTFSGTLCGSFKHARLKKNRRSQCRCLKICTFVQGMLYRNCHKIHERGRRRRRKEAEYIFIFWYILDITEIFIGGGFYWRPTHMLLLNQRGFMIAKKLTG